MPKKQPAILEAFLEDIAGDVLQTYPGFIEASIKGRSGLYVLRKGTSLYYVGLASNLKARLTQHLKDRHERRWDRFSVYLTARSDAAHIRELEALLLRIVRPKGNRVTGRLRAASNLWKALAEHMKAEDEHRRAVILGGVAQRRLRRKTTSNGKGAKALQRIVTRSTLLKAVHLGVEYRATLRPDGHLWIGNELFGSPTAAARACAGRTINGWVFWKVRDRGTWVSLGKLRR
jgi:hypothetical protein